MANQASHQSFTRAALLNAIEQAKAAFEEQQALLENAREALKWFEATHPTDGDQCAESTHCVTVGSNSEKRVSQACEPPAPPVPENKAEASPGLETGGTPRQSHVLQLLEDLKQTKLHLKKKWTFTHDDLQKLAQEKGWNFPQKSFRELVNRVAKRETEFKIKEPGRGKRPTTFSVVE